MTAMSMAWMRRRPAHVPTWVIDAGWALAVAAAVTIAIRAAREPGTRRPDLLAYALGLTLGALLLARRRWPVAVLVSSFAALQVYYVFNYPGISAAVPLGSPCVPPGRLAMRGGRSSSSHRLSLGRSSSDCWWIRNRSCRCSARWCGSCRCGWRSCC